MKKDLVEKVLNNIRVEILVGLVRDLVRIPGHRELPEKESNIAKYIENWLKKAGLSVKTRDVFPDRPNVIALMKGSGNGYSLMYNGHMDTVPAYGWVEEPGPFSGEVMEGKIYGRGSCDMKGAIAAAMVAMEAIQRSEIELKGDLIFTGVVGEEGEGSIGTKEIVQNESIPDMAVVCEPTDLNIFIGHKGSSSLIISARGRPVHSAYPEGGVNAIMLMSDILQALKKELLPRLKRRKHRFLGPPTLTATVIKGGMLTDVVPDQCEVTFNYRYPSGEEPGKVKEEISNLLNKMQEKDLSLNAEVTILNNALGMEIPKDCRIVKSLRQSMKKVTEKNPKIVGTGYWTDASILVNTGRIPTVIFGPGKEEVAHTTLEYVEINQLLTAAQVYALTALDICLQQRAQ